ncbi:MAG: glycine cleavage system protein GcvH [Acidimicrobiia bacterium]|jgi:glycine cleavage system H protein|nr:glycine cleavage system protein GcvH [Acidimicrobiia bacterium]NNC39898.1 glycine cleavage system protein GcvH [Acidimicrobiia bacterium]
MNVPDDRRYTEAHEWATVTADGNVRLGITDYAQEALGDIVYVELPPVGAEFAAGATLAEVESTKSVADVYAPLAGTVAAVNEALGDQPELINSDPYGDGWFVELAGVDASGLEAMLDAAAYGALIED